MRIKTHLIQCRGEALLFVLLYGLYCLAMKYNYWLETSLTSLLPLPASWQAVRQAEVEASQEKGGENNGKQQGDIARLLLVQLRHYCALIGRELHSDEIFS